MSVVIARAPAFWAPGHFILPDQPGKPLVFKFKLRFRRLKDKERKDLDRRIQATRDSVNAAVRAAMAGMPRPDVTPAITDKEVLDVVLVDWDGFPNDDGSIAIYTEAARAQVVEDYPGIESAMVLAYLESRDPSQDLKEVEKNSEALPATT